MIIICNCSVKKRHSLAEVNAVFQTLVHSVHTQRLVRIGRLKTNCVESIHTSPIMMHRAYVDRFTNLGELSGTNYGNKFTTELKQTVNIPIHH